MGDGGTLVAGYADYDDEFGHFWGIGIWGFFSFSFFFVVVFLGDGGVGRMGDGIEVKINECGWRRREGLSAPRGSFKGGNGFCFCCVVGELK